jgi:predicted aldo/keto reductase-like oxidoreductase
MAQLRVSIVNGVNFVDAAMPYHAGACEPFLGRALRNGYREKVKLATKLPHWDVSSREDMDALLNVQLENLQTDHIDYYLLHQLNLADWQRLIDLGIVDFLDSAKADGRIINAGFSFHSSLEEFISLVDAYEWDFCQIQYNYLDEKHQAGTRGLHYAASKGLGVIVMEPLRGGNLAKMPPAIKEIFDEAEHRRSAAEWALRWVWNHPEVICVLSGMNDEAHIEENLHIANEAEPDSLSSTELEIISLVEKEYRNMFKAPCTGCRYCMPCPAGVAIPECFDAYNSELWGNKIEGLFRYLFMVAKPLRDTPDGFASRCTECGECEAKCPQKIEIRKHLKEVANKFEGIKLKVLIKFMQLLMFFKRRKNLKRGRQLGK